MNTLGLEELVECLKAVAEPSRLRILKLLQGNDLTVTDLTTILGQSQPRVSRHLKLLLEARLIHRWQEGSWALFRVNPNGVGSDVLNAVLKSVDLADEVLARDMERLDAVKTARRARASDYFSANAKSWDEIRSLHVPDAEVEKALLATAGNGPFNAMLDIGTGTGRVLELFSDAYRSAIGIDANRDMLNMARTNLDAAGIDHAEVRFGDVYNLSLGRDQFDLIVIHQVLHFLDEPFVAIREARRTLAPGGKLIIVDFAPHDHEFLREQHQHQRLGFDDGAVRDWFAKLELVPADPISVRGGEAGTSDAPLTVKIWSASDSRMLIADDKYDLQKELA